jgi:flagellar biosynthesis chaperone FliJ
VNPRFRLHALERLRTTQLEDATTALAAARRALTDAVAHRDAVAARLARAVQEPRTTPPAAAAAVAHRSVLREKLADADGGRRLAERQLDVAVRAWQDARAGLRAVQTLHDRHRAALAAAAARRDQLVLDDLAAQVALRRAAESGRAERTSAAPGTASSGGTR